MAAGQIGKALLIARHLLSEHAAHGIGEVVPDVGCEQFIARPEHTHRRLDMLREAGQVGQGVDAGSPPALERLFLRSDGERAWLESRTEIELR
ncbi:MAG: hypothetical protein O2854_03855, partial [Chloroflexi bacterium]|nr:hypothetical protein [Chloroflexota bacterium]